MTSELNESQNAAVKHPDAERFYRRRQRVSMGLLVFVVVVGLPIVGVPSLRHRLSTRVLALKSAMAGDIKPATLEVGSNHEPFPAEYQNPAPVPRLPEMAQVTPPTNRVFGMKPETPITRSQPAGRKPKIELIPLPGEKTTETADQGESETTQSKEPELKYQTGKAEQDAYDLLLKSNSTIAGMVQGSNPALKFKSWDAANRGEDTYWVRVKFQSEGNPDVEYIWQVKVQAKEVTPLSYNARSIS